jgi:hypothetical protein
MAMDKLASTPRRKQRLLAKIATGHAGLFSGKFDNTSIQAVNGVYGVSTVAPLYIGTALQLTLSETGGLEVVTSALTLKLDIGSGLQLQSGGLSMLISAASGLTIGAGGLTILLATSNPGLTLTSGLAILLDATSSPSISLGAGGLKFTGYAPLIVEVPTEVTRTTNALLTAIAASVAANKTYYFEAWLFASHDTAAGAYIKFAVSGPAGATVVASVEGPSTSLAMVCETITVGTVTTTTWCILDALKHVVRITGQMKTGSTAGQIEIQFANNDNLTIVRVGAGSFLRLYQM